MSAWMHLKFNRRTRCIYLSLFYVISLCMFGAVCDRKLYTTSTYLYCTLFAFFSMSNSGDNSSLWTWIIPSWVINHSMAIRSANRWCCWQNTCFKGFYTKSIILDPPWPHSHPIQLDPHSQCLNYLRKQPVCVWRSNGRKMSFPPQSFFSFSRFICQPLGVKCWSKNGWRLDDTFIFNMTCSEIPYYE